MKTYPWPKGVRWQAACALWMATVLAAACGGGGDSVTVSGVDATPAGELPAPTGTLLTGTVATGAAVADAQLLARCASGEVAGRSAADGSFRLDLAAVTPPCLLQASGGSRAPGAAAGPLHGVALAAGRAQINPLTELALAQALGQNTAQAFASFNGHAPSATALAAAGGYLAEQLAGMGLARPTGDLFAGAFHLGDANDRLLDALQTHMQRKSATLEALADVAAVGGDLAAHVDRDRAVAIEFVALAGASGVGCGAPLSVPLGSTGATALLKDLRFYLSQVELLRDDGVAVPLKLAPNGPWQHTAANGDAVTLIDLEDGRGGCFLEGSADTHALLRGSVPAGRYVGVRMTVGVPEALNHSDTAAAPAPLDLVAMGWGWQAGRKFAKIELAEPSFRAWSASSFLVHLGSTGCSGNPGLGTVQCSRPNRAVLQFDAFDSDTQRIAVDLVALFAASDVTRNLGGAQGCMSGATDPECEAVFAALGIDWRADGGGSGLPLNAGRSQSVFKVLPR
jgi:uncharacterized repeat protein (TIGR04052 family)